MTTNCKQISEIDEIVGTGHGGMGTDGTAGEGRGGGTGQGTGPAGAAGPSWSHSGHQCAPLPVRTVVPLRFFSVFRENKQNRKRKGKRESRAGPGRVGSAAVQERSMSTAAAAVMAASPTWQAGSVDRILPRHAPTRPFCWTNGGLPMGCFVCKQSKQANASAGYMLQLQVLAKPTHNAAQRNAT